MSKPMNLILRNKLLRNSCKTYAAVSNSIDSKEVEMFTELSSQWMDENGPFNALHSLNKLRVPWIVNNVKRDLNTTKRIVDVGCGGGILSVPLARTGFNVVGIDATEKAVKAARSVTQSELNRRSKLSDRVRFEWTSVEEFSKKPENRGQFDAVVASEIVEHVSDVGGFVSCLAELTKPGGQIYFTTINKTLFSKFAAIWMAEDLFKIVPSGVHNWEKFVDPSELERHLNDAGCQVRAIQGLRYDPFCNNWNWVSSTACNYALLAVKN